MVRGLPSTETQWRLIDIDGDEFPLHRSNVLGRRPDVSGVPDGAQVISLSDAGRVLSRTHALLEVEGETVWVTDLGSTNGTRLLSSFEENDEHGAECEANARTELPEGAALSLGGRKISILRAR